MKEAADAAGTVCYEYNQKKIQETFDSFADKGVTRLEVSDLDQWSKACEGIYSGYPEEDQALIEELRSGEYQ